MTMQHDPVNRSEVAQLLRQIDEENQAAHRALHEMSYGVARHDFISARMGNAQQSAALLIERLGSEVALPLIIEALEDVKVEEKAGGEPQ